MKHRKSFVWSASILAGSFLVLLSGPFLSSCSQEIEQPEQPGGVPVSVSADLKVSICPITPVVPPATRGKGNADSSDDGKTLRVEYVQPDATRSDMSAAEKEIKSAYVVQFNGTASTSTAVSVSGNVAAQLNSGNPVSHDFMLASGVKNRVYVVANPNTTPTAGMTLQALEVVAYTVTTALPATGLPMVAYQDVALGETFNLFQLKSPLAKLTFKTSAGTLSLKGIPSAYSLSPTAAGASAVRPAEVTYTNTVTLTSGTAYYIPANLSGRVDLPSHIFRCSLFAPANSMFVVISANSTTYNIYLGDNSASDFNVVGNYAYAVNATINGADTGDYRVGTPPTTIPLDSGGTANCYMATDANKCYSLNATVMGNGKTTPLPGNMNASSVATAITPTALAPVSAEVLWETWNTTETPTKGSVIGGVSLSNGRVSFYTGSKQGNAVIAVRDAANNIIWSWHIWRTNTTPAVQTLANIVSTSGTFDATGTNTISGLQIMDRNLGALSATPQDNLSTGLMYQWGRKDPFPANAGLTSPNNVIIRTQPAGVPVIPGANALYTVAQSIQQPTTLFRNSNNDWCSSRNDNLWGTVRTGSVSMFYGYNSNPGSKTIYDPCPPGWRTSPAYTYANTKGYSGTFNLGYSLGTGILTSGSSWFPAAGNWSSIATLINAGTNGYYWLSSPATSEDGLFFSFNQSSTSPVGSIAREAGHSVRCSKE